MHDTKEVSLLNTCTGFLIDSESPMLFGRSGSGHPLHIEMSTGQAPTELGRQLVEWPRIPGKRAKTTIYLDGHSYGVTIGDYQQFIVDPQHGSIRVWGDTEPPMREALLWSTPTALCAIHRGDIALHAASVDLGGRAVLLAAPTTAGKTTLAAAFHAAGFRTLSDDLSCCRTEGGDWVYPGPAVLRMRPDMASTLGLPDTHVPYQSDVKIYNAIDPHRRGTGDKVPLCGILFLRRGVGPPRFEARRPPDTLRDLWGQSFFLPGDEDHVRGFGGLADVVGRIPAWDLFRELTVDALTDTIEAIVRQTG
jgi:hypothetical protein